MKIIEVPIFNEDGSLQFTQYVSPEEAQRLLSFAINFMMAIGNNATIVMPEQEEDNAAPCPTRLSS